MSRHLTLRVSHAEFDFLDRIAREKNMNRTAVARQLFLQNIALDAIKTEIAGVIDSRFSGMQNRLDALEKQVDQTVRRDDLIAATNYITERIKKGVQK